MEEEEQVSTSSSTLTVNLQQDYYQLNCSNSSQDLNCSDQIMAESPYDLYEPSVGIVILLSLCYGLISVGAVIGNGLVIYMVVGNRRMRTVTNFFIANLALADVVIGMFSIPFQFQAALLQRWHLPEVMCNLCPFFQNVSVNTSIFTLIAIAMDRYSAIIHPFSKKSSKKGTKIRILIIWFLSVLLAVPQIIAFRVTLVDGNVPQCIPVNISVEAFTWYMFALCFVQYFVPLCLLCFAYTRIMLNLWGRRAPGEADDRRDANLLKNKKKAIKVLMFVVVTFGVCWLPLQTYNVLSVIFKGVNSFKYINIVWFFSHWLSMSNSCVNPFIYFFCHTNWPLVVAYQEYHQDKFKKEFQDRFKWCFKTISQKRSRKKQNGIRGSSVYRGGGGRNYYLSHSISSDEGKADVTRSEANFLLTTHNRGAQSNTLDRPLTVSTNNISSSSNLSHHQNERYCVITTRAHVTTSNVSRYFVDNEVKKCQSQVQLDHHGVLRCRYFSMNCRRKRGSGAYISGGSQQHWYRRHHLERHELTRSLSSKL